MVDMEVVKKRLTQLSISLNKIERFQGLSLEEYLKDDIVQDVVEYNLFISINMMIDLATHIVVDNKMGAPNSLAETFVILYKANCITKENLKTYRNMVGLRNLLSHEYIDIDKKIIYDVMKNRLGDIKSFILFINKKLT